MEQQLLSPLRRPPADGVPPLDGQKLSQELAAISARLRRLHDEVDAEMRDGLERVPRLVTHR